jgi:hypothetical protein
MLLDKPRPGLLPDPSTVKAELLQPQSWQNSPCLMGTVSLPMSDGMNEGPERSYSLHQSQSPGRRKRRTGNLRTERRSHVTWGSSKRRKAQDDGGTIVLKCSGQRLRQGEGFQRVRSFQERLTRMSYKTLERLEHLQKLNSNKQWVNHDLYRLM